MQNSIPRRPQEFTARAEARSGDLLLRLLRLRGWAITERVNGSVELDARMMLPGGEELSIVSVGASTSEAVLSLFVRACEAQGRIRRLYAGRVVAADGELVQSQASKPSPGLARPSFASRPRRR